MKVDTEMFHSENEMMVKIGVFRVLLTVKLPFEKSSVTIMHFHQDYRRHFPNTYFLSMIQ